MKTMPVLLLVGATLLSACATSRSSVATDLETPSYRVVLEDGPFTLRRYEPYVVAETTVDEPDFDAASRAGFRRLAGYIFGGNQGVREIPMTAPVTAERASDGEGEKIAMTAPVGAQASDDGWRITFMMPRKYDLESLPIADDERVTFARVPASCRAVVTFSWLTTEARIAEHAAQLRSWAAQHGLQVQGEPVVARYNDPFTLPWRRTNEVWVDVAGGDDAAPARDDGAC